MAVHPPLFFLLTPLPTSPTTRLQLSEEDMATVYDESTYANNPPEYPDLLTNTKDPYNAEARLSQLTDAHNVSIRKIAEFNKNKTELLKDPPVQEMPVQSMITKPSPHHILAAAKADSIPQSVGYVT